MMAENNLNVAVVGNCSINALVDQRAKIVFSCLPRFDSDPMFCYLLSGGGNDVEYGFWDIILEGFSHSHQEYEKNTAIVRTKLYAVNGASLEVVVSEIWLLFMLEFAFNDCFSFRI